MVSGEGLRLPGIQGMTIAWLICIWNAEVVCAWLLKEGAESCE